jgi:glucose/arabinose dehydrogenase
MRIPATPLTLAAAVAVLAVPAHAQDARPSIFHDYQVVPVVEGLDRPWAITFLDGGDMLVTEKSGQLRIVRDGQLLDEPVAGVPEAFTQGQAGLLDVEPHPDFASNRLLYLSYSKPLGGDESTTAIIRGRFENDVLTEVEEIFEANSSGAGHYGSRLAFDADGYLFASVGDRQVPPRGDLAAHPAQDLSNHHGVIIRIHDDGRVPDDNPFVDREDAEPEIWSYGHRNPQGLAVHPETNQVWSNEHGPQGGDEVNLIEKGLNYGWPVVGYGVNYRSGSAIHDGTHREGMEPPEHVWVPSIATSGLLIYTGEAFPQWQGDMFVGGLSGEQVARLDMNDDGSIGREETMLLGMARIRDVAQGPDGLIYLAMDNRNGDPLTVVRLEPASTN